MPVLSSKLGGAEETSDPTGCYLHIIKSDGGGGYDSFVISLANFSSLLQAAIDAVEVLAGTRTEYLNQSANFNDSFDAGTKILQIDVQQVSGTVDIQIGSSAGAQDIVPNISFSSGIETFTINKIFDSSLTVYVTRNSGTFNLWIHVLEALI